jgi:hypothetical protein
VNKAEARTSHIVGAKIEYDALMSAAHQAFDHVATHAT